MSQSHWPYHRPSYPVIVPNVPSPYQWLCHRPCGHVVVPVTIPSSQCAMSQSQWHCYRSSGHVMTMLSSKRPVTVPLVLPSSQLFYRRPSGLFCVPVALSSSQWPCHRPIDPFIVQVRHVTVPVALLSSQWPCYDHVIIQAACHPPLIRPSSQLSYRRPSGLFCVRVALSSSKGPCHSPSGPAIVLVALS